MDYACLIVAAGRGVRAGGDLPKQYQMLAGQPILRRTLEAVLRDPACDRVQAVIHPGDASLYRVACDGLADPRLLSPVHGGATRTDSVGAGLAALAAQPPERVLVHDAARPFVTQDVLTRVAAAVAPGVAAFPALPIVDALWRAEGAMAVAPVRRDELWRAQTPQGFWFDDIRAAHAAAAGPADDDIALVRQRGLDVRIVLGDGNNFKITLPADFVRAERLLKDAMDIRTGTGFDVHAFTDGSSVTLCGVEIPFDKALSGHSDADVAMHAITDALFGAIAEGDIGQWFPPSEVEWKGAASSIFLEKAMERVSARGFTVSNIDCTIICERPKVGPHAAAMRAEIARITGVESGRISVKATTSEQLGFTGRGEGIAAMATATVVSA
ncbi:bifunctional 2-C-methyl-D-erythritol 4-phosphate cytidylyltransferase/2-C-methyl-D-erythritol 2,4-cyclodiphosphate synthase [Oceanibium sediminis]|uniref:bifunctional 2-C-methyl-D-erythritol 4-phosphate cytidylyltransferase/2-C-methyl-D-erythritol 2,4-cyclodiphosphate synthase n=1 Tax=Oceanibium sediminis TaxID=2026339 RepID=UPI000DD3B947|nr:bifunctional 2-C-methyl-D-erythritol 4-phosphate cytidylyltransferase/2-C-methyl-D-erythritol 2,4-cyclodiphosphate synthase [Oceanibium sediminis]